MRITPLLVLIIVAACGHASAPSPAPSPAPMAPSPASAAPTPAPDVAPTQVAEGETSACAFASLDALCTGFREHHAAGSPGWVSEGCGFGARRTSSGAYGEVVLVGVHVSYEAGALPLVERPLLESTVREPTSASPPSTGLMVAGRIGARWFPLWVGSGGANVTFALDAAGDALTISIAEQSRAEHIAMVVEQGVPKIVSSDTNEHLAICGFVPVVHATPLSTLPSDEASVAARARALAILAHGRWSVTSGVRRVVVPDAQPSTIEILEAQSGGCGGGGCTTGVRTRTILGTMPEQGVHYFNAERGPQLGCVRNVLPEAGRSTFVEVAPVATGQTVACGFGGFDGTTTRTWVVIRVFTPSAH